MYARSLNVAQAESHMLAILKGPPVQCALCGREFERISPGHLKTHADYLRSKRGIKWYRPKKDRSTTETDSPDTEMSTDTPNETWKSRDETLIETYERLFGGKNQLNACVKKLLELYQPHRGQWLLMDRPVLPQYATWYQVSADNPAFRPNRLCTSIVKEHLLFDCTIGVFPKSQYETYFVTWDIDSRSLYDDPSWNATMEARKAVTAITSILRKWGLHPHVIMSGQKGYHVSVFFRSAVSIKMVMNLYHAILQHPDGPVSGSTGLKIECLPVQRGNKLPLGIHWGAGGYCGFMDPWTLAPLEDPYRYLLEIIPDSPRVLSQIEDEALTKRRRESTVIQVKSWSRENTEAAFKVGITAPSTRHDTLVRVASYVRNTPSICPDSLSEFIDVLLEWSRKQYDHNRDNIKTGWTEHVRDVQRVAKYAWGHPLTPGVPRAIRVTPGTIHWIRNQTSVLAEQQVMFAAWFEMSKVGEQFHLGYEQVREMTLLAKESLDKAIAFNGIHNPFLNLFIADFLPILRIGVLGRWTPSRRRSWPRLVCLLIIIGGSRDPHDAQHKGD